MKSLTVNKPLAGLLALCLNGVDACAMGNSSVKLPAMRMHIFGEPAPAAPDRTQMLELVVFDDSGDVQSYPTEPGQHDLTLDTAEAHVPDVQAEGLPAPETMNIDDMVIRFHADTGYRQDKLNWTIAAPDGSPNVLSELTWDNIESVTFEAGAKVKTPSNWIIEGNVLYGEIIDGNNQDSDFFGDNRTEEFSRSNNNASDGNVLDLSMGFGYQFDIGRWRDRTPVWSLIPKVGVSYHAQNFKMTNGFQTIPAWGHFPAVLDSSYEASWYGPWAGLSSEFNLTRYVQLWADFQLHYAYYEATANWNLREDFQHPESFTHEAEGTGIIAEAGSRFFILSDLFMDISVSYKDWEADKKGIDTVFFSDGVTAETRFNGVNWQTIGATIGVHYAF
ncbi:MAG: TonB-dependent receptor [Gammaproteobacteria bacterium]